jgi:esterase/lipase superfamily enzyme
MGARLVTRVLSELELQKINLEKLSRVVYAAADLGENELREVWKRIEPRGRKGWTLYTSKNDFALMASRIIHGESRLGDSTYRTFVIDKADTVDATSVAPFLRGYGHSYLIDNRSAQRDIRRWILQGTPASARNLRPGVGGTSLFWELSP